MMLKEMMKKEIQTKRNPECGNLEIQFCYETKSGADAVNHLLQQATHPTVTNDALLQCVRFRGCDGILYMKPDRLEC
ncbi:hypothetical protein T05_9223 [Trichinella murrelli]|uniref:Uncharacterized protein n=1 Tax=Trichinella murrelli TaxID=144512 RepID=A0A0V0T2Y2_9BILA|nr:hypothetical protein T05_7975 [Trichinella murrelli]KRX34276.1 hypothetical protein T05_10525 [Trichinella murrelli]KRX35210.1 hypothetical protein T05_9223 [Trichinella murrelli]